MVEIHHGPLPTRGDSVSSVGGEFRRFHGASADDLDVSGRDAEGLETGGEEAAEIDVVSEQPTRFVEIEPSEGLGHLGTDFVAGAADRWTEGNVNPLRRDVAARQLRNGGTDNICGATSPARVDRGDNSIAGKQHRDAIGGPDQQPNAFGVGHQTIPRTDLDHLIATGGDFVDRSAVDLFRAPESTNPVVKDGRQSRPLLGRTGGRPEREGHREGAVTANEGPIAAHGLFAPDSRRVSFSHGVGPHPNGTIRAPEAA